jgi:hypothetical protein
MEVEVNTGREFDGTNWYVTIDGTKLGPPLTKVEADDKLKWLRGKTLQQWVDIYSAMIERGFAEREKENG